ncbi:hypothetical protein [Catenuloplanes japonicus]|uniref:hypothetical protein n=1 Tax=Catenuloplanes japonicus TaxID=33876 RepID=UPI0005247A7F|nr:hypothetical protein [Catenuloplanes japonicus]
MSRGRLIARILITAVVGGTTYLIGALVKQPPAQAVMLAFFVGGVVLVVQLLAEFDTRVAAVEAGQGRLTGELRDLLAEKFAAVSEATELYGRVEHSPLRDDVVRVAHSALQVGHELPPLVVNLARAQLQYADHLLRQVGSGEATYEGEDREWLLALTHHVASTLDAISPGSRDHDGRFLDEGLWRTELGRRYLEAQARALRNGVAIRRLFILEHEDLLADADFREIYDEQAAMGIRVRAIALAEIRIAGIRFVSDFILFDDVVSYENELAPTKHRFGLPMYIRTSLFMDSRRIDRQRQRFEALWAAAHELGPAGQGASTRSAAAEAQPQERLTPPPP